MWLCGMHPLSLLRHIHTPFWVPLGGLGEHLLWILANNQLTAQFSSRACLGFRSSCSACLGFRSSSRSCLGFRSSSRACLRFRSSSRACLGFWFSQHHAPLCQPQASRPFLRLETLQQCRRLLSTCHRPVASALPPSADPFSEQAFLPTGQFLVSGYQQGYLPLSQPGSRLSESI